MLIVTMPYLIKWMNEMSFEMSMIVVSKEVLYYLVCVQFFVMNIFLIVVIICQKNLLFDRFNEKNFGLSEDL